MTDKNGQGDDVHEVVNECLASDGASKYINLNDPGSIIEYAIKWDRDRRINVNRMNCRIGDICCRLCGGKVTDQIKDWVMAALKADEEKREKVPTALSSKDHEHLIAEAVRQERRTVIILIEMAFDNDDWKVEDLVGAVNAIPLPDKAPAVPCPKCAEKEDEESVITCAWCNSVYIEPSRVTFRYRNKDFCDRECLDIWQKREKKEPTDDR